MTRRQNDPLRLLTSEERRWLARVARSPASPAHNATAKLMTLFHPATGKVRVKGAGSCANAVLHPWLKEQLAEILDSLPSEAARRSLGAEENRAEWKRWQEGLSVKVTLPEELPPLRMLLVLDNLTGHKTPELLLWMFARGVMVLYTPLGASWLNMTESMQRILARRALEGHHPESPEEIIEWLEATARGWNRDPRRHLSGVVAERRDGSVLARGDMPSEGRELVAGGPSGEEDARP